MEGLVILIILAIPAAILIWLLWIVGKGFIDQMPSQRRKRRSRYCRCGYDLTGNVTGICPECGTRITWK